MAVYNNLVEESKRNREDGITNGIEALQELICQYNNETTHREILGSLERMNEFYSRISSMTRIGSILKREINYQNQYRVVTED